MRKLSEDEFLELVRLCIKAHPSQRAAADAWGVTAQHLSDMLRKKRSPGRVLPKALGYDPITLYVPKS